MTKTNVQKLIDLGGAPLGARPGSLGGVGGGDDRLRGQLFDLLQRKNGFYAFESALHVFPAASPTNGPDLEEWNSDTSWRHEYGDLASDKLFFAEDAFGNQFCIEDGHICAFDAETGACERMCSSFEEWAERILDDHDVLTGYPLLHAWQAAHGAIASGHRILPRVPFCLGGEFAIENLYASDAVRGMRFRGDLARQIRHLPDEAQVVLRVVE